MGASSWLLPDVATALPPIMEEFLFPSAVSLTTMNCGRREPSRASRGEWAPDRLYQHACSPIITRCKDSRGIYEREGDEGRPHALSR